MRYVCSKCATLPCTCQLFPPIDIGKLLSFSCKKCPMTTFLCVNELRAHEEAVHQQPFIGEVGKSNGHAR